MLYIIRITPSASPPAYVRGFEDGILGVVHDPKQATCYDNAIRACQVKKKITSADPVEVVDRDSALRL